MSTRIPPIYPLTSALCSTAKNITIREEHTESETSDRSEVSWTYTGRIPASGIAREIWKDAKENKKLFRIETDSFVRSTVVGNSC